MQATLLRGILKQVKCEVEKHKEACERDASKFY